MSVNDDDMRVCEQDGDVWCLQVLELSLFSYPIIIVMRIPYMLVRIALYLGVLLLLLCHRSTLRTSRGFSAWSPKYGVVRVFTSQTDLLVKLTMV